MKETILVQFNNLVKQFLDQLYKQFPTDVTLNKARLSFELSKTGTYWLNLFMETMREHEKWIMERDPKFIDAFSEQFDLKSYYDKCSEQSRNAIWEYLQILYVTGHSYENYRPEFMKTVESVAGNCENNFK